jgi:hypothetical protein
VAQEKVDKLERQVEKLIEAISGMKDLDDDIVEQHERFIRLLEGNNNSSQPSTYSY